ncbi:hypothetical protein CIG75_19100 [Tumebacillus algifaecis]|uniref:Uncharacterized protein n=1 Tax=Tumebacillus algifaecis TaxID=1214604 RepID=A0A223D5J6_9BACL|nr:hypothetical protein [Tumebacillus algifaecis]ASS76841.1 hypothetical protein CIG75_19100 [Tumebacillus algifaecis]
MDYYSVKARQRETAFFRRAGPGVSFRTGTGRTNTITEITEDVVFFQTAKSKRPARISRQKLRDALRHMYVRRSATRREMERYAAYNSALLGLVSIILAGLTKITRTVRGLLRLTMLGIRYFFSGCERDPKALQIVRQQGGLMALMSYHWLRKDTTERWMSYMQDLGFTAQDEASVLLDSGAFSVWNAAQRGADVEITVEEYADFIERNKHWLWGWMNLDVIGDDAATRRNYEYLIARGLRPIPVWPITGSLDELARIVEEDHELVAIGGTAIQLQRMQHRKVREKLTAVARRFGRVQNFHLLGCAVIGILKEFAHILVSADSKAPTSVTGNGRVITKYGQRQAKELEREERTIRSVREFVKLESYLPQGYARATQIAATF